MTADWYKDPSQVSRVRWLWEGFYLRLSWYVWVPACFFLDLMGRPRTK